MESAKLGIAPGTTWELSELMVEGAEGLQIRESPATLYSTLTSRTDPRRFICSSAIRWKSEMSSHEEKMRCSTLLRL
jgi:hypothetical protein